MAWPERAWPFIIGSRRNMSTTTSYRRSSGADRASSSITTSGGPVLAKSKSGTCSTARTLAPNVKATQALWFHRGTARVFFIVPTARHSGLLMKRSRFLLNGAWRATFHALRVKPEVRDGSCTMRLGLDTWLCSKPSTRLVAFKRAPRSESSDCHAAERQTLDDV